MAACSLQKFHFEQGMEASPRLYDLVDLEGTQ
jgi:hypothetical protein